MTGALSRVSVPSLERVCHRLRIRRQLPERDSEAKTLGLSERLGHTSVICDSPRLITFIRSCLHNFRQLILDWRRNIHLSTLDSLANIVDLLKYWLKSIRMVSKAWRRVFSAPESSTSWPSWPCTNKTRTSHFTMILLGCSGVFRGFMRLLHSKKYNLELLN